MGRIIAIGDVHGCAQTFRKLLFEKLSVHPDDTIYCLGDLIDRGPDSKGAIDTLLDLRRNGFTVQTLRGNHEEILLQVLAGRGSIENWIKNGGDSLLASFGVVNVTELPDAYLRFIRDTRHYIATDAHIFVHAGLNLDLPDPFLDTTTMLWDRTFAYHADKLNHRILVHGHTPKPLEYILKQPVAGSVNIDSGCVYAQQGYYGHLTALNLTDKEYVVQEYCE